MPDITGWIIQDQLTSPVDPKQIPDEATALAIEVVEAAKRYEPINRVDFFDALIGDLELARQRVHDQVHGDDEVIPG